MATSARIEELKKKFDENPRRYFAPLANEFRKMGDFDQAILICQEFLPQQPGHMSGHIVYGQALFEAQRFDEARGVFETALSLDPENLIALRHLGDICREDGDLEGARSWYRRVLDADPRNEEIASLLAALDEPAGVPWTTPTPGSVGAVGESRGDEPDEQPLQTAPPESSIVDFHAMLTQAAIEAPLPPSGHVPTTAADTELIDLDVSDFGTGARPPVIDDLEVERAIDTPFGFESAASARPEPPSSPFSSRMPEPEPFTAAQATPVSAPPVVPAPTPPSAPPRSASETTEERETAASAGSGSEFVTETMAELYVQQGHLGEAVGVYRQLVVRYPGDEVLRARLEELQSALRTTEAPQTKPASAEPPPAEPPRTRAEFIEPQRPERQPSRVQAAEPSIPASETSEASGARLLDDLAIDEAFEESPLSSAPSGPTIRDFLSGLAEKHPVSTNGAPPATSSSASHTRTPRHDEPEIPEADFESAAARYAEIPGAPRIDTLDEAGARQEAGSEEPERAREAADRHDARSTVGGSLDVLFSGAETSQGDEEAASMLASAFTGTDEGSHEISGQPARRAQDELSLDHVFRERGSTERSQSSFSFDQFFAQGGADRDASGGEQAGAPSDEKEDDDIQQFNAWLEGLKKT